MNFEQSIPISFAFACLSGLIKVMATLLLAYPDAKGKEGSEWSKCSLRLAFVGNILLQLASSTSSTFSAFFGPVSLVRPTATASQLVSNMILFSLLGLEFFPKDKQVGTCMVVVAALLLPVNGPGAQNNQDILELVTHPIAILWSLLLTMTTLGSTLYLAWRGVQKLPPSWRTALLLCAQVGSAVICTTTAKMVVLVESKLVVAVVIVFWLSMGGIVVYATILQSTAVSQASFIPLMVATDMIVNALTGILVWEDWRVIDSWWGYGCVFIQLALGNYLLSSLDVWTQAQARYGPRVSIALGWGTASHPGQLFQDPQQSLLLLTMKKCEEYKASQAAAAARDDDEETAVSQDALEGAKGGSVVRARAREDNEEDCFELEGGVGRLQKHCPLHMKEKGATSLQSPAPSPQSSQATSPFSTSPQSSSSSGSLLSPQHSLPSPQHSLPSPPQGLSSPQVNMTTTTATSPSEQCSQSTTPRNSRRFSAETEVVLKQVSFERT